MTPRKLHVFISSPGDVGEERVLANRVLDRLEGEFLGRLQLERILWEHEPLRATSHFQEQIVLPSATDIVICILWSRLGTRLPEGFRRPDGTTYASGTEFEFEDAARAHREKGVPDLLVYRKTVRATTEFDDEAVVQERIRQKKALDAFIDHWFGSAQQGFKAAFHAFENAEQFESQLEAHLHKLITDRLPAHFAAEPEGGMPVRWHRGSPYRGLEVFGFEHEAVFFGRTAAVGAVKEALVRQALAGRAFLLILGMSGCGKSSLVRAGVLPTLTKPGVIEGIGLWRWSVFRPSDAATDLCDGLAAAMVHAEALPELEAGGYDRRELAALFREAPAPAVAPLRLALQRAAEIVARDERLARPPESRLALVVDQLEELFTLERVSAGQREAFVALLSVLARSGLVWVIATMRSDFYPRCTEVPELAALKEGAGQLDLLPPTFAEIEQMIRYPTRAAGLRFEVDPATGQRLDQVLHETAARDPRALPLLEFTLEELFQRRTADGVLTFAAYSSLGGLEGALAQRAEEVFAGLEPAVQATLPALLRALVTIDPDAAVDTVAARRVPLAGLVASPERKRLLDAFIQARLLVSDRADDGQPVIGVAHEALLRHWPRLQGWVAQDRDFLRARARVADGNIRWRAEGKAPDYLLSPGKPLAEAEDILQKRRPDLDAEVIDYIETSVRTWNQRRRRRLRAMVAGAAVIFAVLSGFAAYSFWQKLEADDARENEERIARAEIVARAQADKHARNEKRLRKKADQAEKRIRQEAEQLKVIVTSQMADNAFEAGNVVQARGLLQEIPEKFRGWEWHYRKQHFQGSYLTLYGHLGGVRAVAFSPDGKRVASAGDDGTVKLWQPETGREVRTLHGHSGLVRAVAFSPDGKQLASGSDDQTVKLWEARTGREVRTLREHSQRVNAVAFSPDGQRLASASNDNTVKLWQARTGRELLTLRGHTDFVVSVAFSPDGQRLASAGHDGTVKLWQAQTGQELLTLREPTGGGFYAVAFSPDGQRLAGAGFETVKLWQAQTGRELPALRGHTREVLAVAFSPDGQRLASTDSVGTVKLWQARTGRELLTLRGHLSEVHGVAFSPDGQRLASAGKDNTVKLWQARTGRELLALRGHNSGVTAVAFSPDGQRLASASSDETVKLWQAQTGQPLRTLHGHAGFVTAVAFSPDGQRLASASYDQTVKLWQAQTGRELLTLRGHTKLVTAVAFSPDGRRLASASYDKTVKLWQAQTGRELRTLRGHTDVVISVAFSPDGQRLASAGGDKTVKLWQAQTGRPLRTLRGHTNYVNAVAFSSGGQRLASAGRDNTVRLWQTRTGRELLTLRGHTGEVHAVAFSPDGERLASAGKDNTVKLWQARTGRELLTLRGHTGEVTALTFSPNGQRLASASGDFTVKLWQAPRDRKLLTLGGHTDTVSAVAFSSDGQRLASAGEDNTVKLWQVGTDHPPLTLRGHTKGVSAVAFSPDGQRLASADFDGTVKVWQGRTGRQLLALRGHKGGVTSLSFSGDGLRLASAGIDGTVKVWQAHAGRQLLTLQPHYLGVYAVAFSPDGHSLFGREGMTSGALLAWDAQTGRRLPAPQGSVPFGVPKVVRHPTAPLLALAQENLVELIDLSPPHVIEFAYGEAMARFDEAWHDEQAAVSEKAGEWFAVIFHRGQIAAHSPANATNWANLEAAAAKLGDRAPVLAVCDRLLRQDPGLAPLYFRRARLRSRQGHFLRAAANYLAGLICAVVNPTGWPEFAQGAREEADGYAQRGEWTSACRDYADAFLWQQQDAGHLYRLAWAELAAGRLDSSRTTCRYLFERYRGSQDRKDVQTGRNEAIVSTACLVPQHGLPATDLVELARHSVRTKRTAASLDALGAAEYRAGRYADAVATLQDAVKLHGQGGSNWTKLFLAMAYHQLHQADKARAWFAKASLGTDPGWGERLIGQRLGQEAAGLLKMKEQPKR